MLEVKYPYFTLLNRLRLQERQWGSTLGPLGAVIGSVVGALLLTGLGAQSIINTANKDAISEFVLCVERIRNSNIGYRIGKIVLFCRWAG